MRLLDLSKFQKVAEDKDTTTMRHKDGHEMTILIAKLPKIHAEQLKRLKMAEGGVAKKSYTTPKDNPTEDNTGDGYYRTPDDSDDSNRSPASDAPASTAAPEPFDAEADFQQRKAVTDSTLAKTGVQQMGTAGDPGVDTQNAEDYASKNMNPPAVPIPPNLGNVENVASLPGAAAQLSINAANQKGEVDRKMAEGMVEIEKQAQANEIANQKSIAQAYNEIAQPVQHFDEYMAQNPIDPKHFGQSMGTVQKITTALGLLVGGFTGGYSGTGKNPAYDWLKDQQENDIAAQLQNREGQKTVLGAYQQLYGDHTKAIAATKASWDNWMVHRIGQLAQTMGIPMSNVNVQNSISTLLNDRHQNLMNGAMYGNPSNGGGTGVTSLLAPGQKAPMSPSGKGVNGKSAGNGSNAVAYPGQGEFLAPDATAKLNRLLLRGTGGNGMSPDPRVAGRLQDIKDQYAAAQNKERVMGQIEQIYNNMGKNATYGGYLAGKVNPKLLGAAGSAIAAKAGLSMGPVGAMMGSGVGEGLGEGVGHIGQQTLRAVGGQAQSRFEADQEALKPLIASFLNGPGQTPTGVSESTGAFIPTVNDIRSPETMNYYIKLLRHKGKSLMKTDALNDFGMLSSDFNK